MTLFLMVSGFLLGSAFWLRGRQHYRAAREALRLRDAVGGNSDQDGPRWSPFRDRGF